MKLLKKTVLFSLLLMGSQNLWAMEGQSPSRTPLLSHAPGTPGYSRGAEETVDSVREQAILLSRESFFDANALPSQPTKATTTLKRLLNAHDSRFEWVQSAKRQGGREWFENRDIISKDTFKALQVQEEAIRKTINLVWASLMLFGNDSDVELFRKPKSAPFLFNGAGVEAVGKEPRALKNYSFPDYGDTNTHVFQIRMIADILGIDLDADLRLPFNPVQKKKRKKMVKAYQEMHPEMSFESSYLCMLEILKIGREEEDERSVATLSPVKKRAGEESGELIAAQNQARFDAIMKAAQLRKIKSEPAQYITNIVKRLQGLPTETAGSAGAGAGAGAGQSTPPRESNPFEHSSFTVGVPFGSLLRPTTTKAYLENEASLRAYWQETEKIIREAEEVIQSDLDLSSRVDLEAAKRSGLSMRVTKLIANVLSAVSNYQKANPSCELPSFSRVMLGDLRITGDSHAFYSGDLKRDLRSIATERPGTDRRASALSLGRTSSDIKSCEDGLVVLDALLDEFRKIKSS